MQDLTEKTLATERKYTGKIISVDLLDIELPDGRRANIFMVFLGGGIGCALRYGAGLVVTSTMFPLATFVVNVIGSMAIGLFGGWASRFGWSEETRLLLTTGLCGGFTTFSTFSKESLALAEAGRWCAFAAYAIGSVAVGIAAVALGYWITRH